MLSIVYYVGGGDNAMKSALDELFELLSSIGLEDTEINMLLGRFLEEEAHSYVECMRMIKEKLQEDRKYS